MIRVVVLMLTSALLLFGSVAQSPHAVQIGYCGGISDIDAVKAAGFDYIELRTAEIAALTDADFEKLRARLKVAGISVPATNQFVPPDMRLTGPDINKDHEIAYVQKALDRVALLGASTVVFGSGTARQYPDGFSKADAFEQLVDFCKRLAPEARARHIVIAIEPLRHEESNIINSLAEGLQLVDAVREPNIQLNLDYFHLAMEKEDPAIILKAGNHVVHVHMANPTGRAFPLRWEEYNYGPLFENLRKIGYDKEISIEGSSKDFAAEAPRAIAFLRSAMATPGSSK
jgi:D-psicose/D-tagatose/L-ribulose 3-epimerase